MALSSSFLSSRCAGYFLTGHAPSRTLDQSEGSSSLDARKTARRTSHTRAAAWGDEDIGNGINQGKWTGYVEKDTAGQKNIYSVEPTVYVADSAFATSTRGTSTTGVSGTLTTSAFVGLAAVSGAAIVLFSLGGAPAPTTVTYDGPPLSYYVKKFSDEAAATALQAAVLEAPAVADAVAVEDVAKPLPAVVSEVTEVAEVLTAAIPEETVEVEDVVAAPVSLEE
eukprot:TRINITY_DN2583_c0_g1_i1.p1 TRINITY_DN2583_c0_g1~~TRINITY_DN2583_c0_g1_i1.p1  ORF type:complete len:224 (-),score=52.64 TRINITY_DN2583_c0_g1_i1:299-970(-)